MNSGRNNEQNCTIEDVRSGMATSDPSRAGPRRRRLYIWGCFVGTRDYEQKKPKYLCKVHGGGFPPNIGPKGAVGGGIICMCGQFLLLERGQYSVQTPSFPSWLKSMPRTDDKKAAVAYILYIILYIISNSCLKSFPFQLQVLHICWSNTIPPHPPTTPIIPPVNPYVRLPLGRAARRPPTIFVLNEFERPTRPTPPRPWKVAN